MGGESNKLIARQYDIAKSTVKDIKAILRKISVKNRTQAALWAHNNPNRVGSPSPVNGRVSYS